MKNIKFIAFVFAAFLFVGCEDYFGSDSNVDPDNPISVTESVILPQVQARIAYTYGGDMARFTGLCTHHIDGLFRQFFVFHNYDIIGSDLDATWSNVFTGSMQSNRRMIKQAEESGFNHFVGVGKALEAFTMMAATDIWGDIPYSDAFRFDEAAVYSPTFDSQQSIYDALFLLIDEARGALLKDDGGLPLSGDLYYGGDASKWVKFCNALEARGRLHLSKVNGNTAYTAALAALDKGAFESSADDFAFSFGTGATENAPMFQYVEQRDDAETGVAYTDLMTSLNDPRIDTYGQPHDADHPIFTKDQTLLMLSFTEQEFIRAEAEFMLGNADAAYAAYLSGIESSFNEAALGGPDTLYANYIAQSNIGVGASNLTLNNIMTQKYIAQLLQPEVFVDWRRTGLPNLAPNVGTEIPRRMPYAQTEVLANENLDASPSNFIFTRVWWDSQ